MSRKKIVPELSENLFRFGSNAEVELAMQKARKESGLLTAVAIAHSLGARIVGKVNKKNLPVDAVLGVRTPVTPLKRSKRK